MQFTDVFIRRPVFASAVNLLLLVIGIAAFFSLPVRQYPMIETNTILVTTIYNGASADLMSGFVSTPLENSIGSIDGIDYMVSANSQNTSTITVYLQIGYPFEEGITDTMNQVTAVRWMLPKEIQDPVITKSDPNAQPTVYIAFKSDSLTDEAVTDFLLRVVQPQIQTLNGVSSATILGEREYAMRINLNSGRMSSLNISPNDVMKAIRNNNLQAAAGTVYSELQQYNILANTDMQTADEFDQMAIQERDGYIIRIRDVGKSLLGALNYNSSAVINGVPTTTIGVIPTSDANPLAVSKAVEKLLPSIQKQLPSGITAEVVYDSSLFIEASIEEVNATMIEAGILVIIVIFLFLGNFRAIIIPIVTIPLSLLGVCGIMLALGYTINTITLLAWVLAIGLVVDDAIVVLENIYRHLEEGLSPLPAAIIGAREIGFAIIAMTITLAAVYAPIGFVGGLVGILFSEFAFTLAAAVVVSGFVALTLSPMMCSKLLKYDKNEKGFTHKIDVFFETIVIKNYKRILTRVIAYRKIIMVGSLLSYGLFAYLFITTPSELAPSEDQGVVLAYVSGPTASNIKFTELYTNYLIKIYEGVPEMKSFGIINGFGQVNAAISFLNLVPWGDRKRSAEEIIEELFPQMWAIPGLKAFPINPPALPATGGIVPIQFVLKNTDPGKQGIMELNNAQEALMQAMEKHPGFQGIDSNMKITMPQANVVIDRNKAGDLGVTMQEIASALNTMFGNPQDVQFSMAGRGYYVIPEFEENFDFKANPDDINNIYVRSTKNNQLIPLSTVAKIENKIGPQTLNHFQQLPSVTISASTTPDFVMGDAFKFLVDYTNTNFPHLQWDTAGELRQYLESLGAMNAVLCFAIIIIFLVLAAQFESFRDPIVILFFVMPLTLTGALVTLRLTNGTMNIYSEIGLTTLIGLISKHGILIVEFANQLQEKGMSKLDAAITSASMRIRPILMTTFAMVLGALPLAIATGAGANARHAIGWVIVGGMSIGTIFSLFVVPSIYVLIAGTHKTDDTLDKEIAEAERLTAEREGDLPSH